MTFSEATRILKQRLQEIYDPREAAHIAEWIMEDVTGLPRLERMVLQGELTDAQQLQLDLYTTRLEQATPVQYVTGYAWFMGERFIVNEDVLIPRPETEELVDWVRTQVPGSVTILDIGTGSGCIPVMLRKLIPAATVHTVDVSAAALSLARQNADTHGVEIIFHQANFLEEQEWEKLPVADVIVSNPPYIPERDKHTMHPNVLDHEPHLALFVPDEDALLFYRKIMAFAKTHLRPGGHVFVETHHELAGDVAALAERSEIRKDISGKQRMVRLWP